MRVMCFLLSLLFSWLAQGSEPVNGETQAFRALLEMPIDSYQTTPAAVVYQPESVADDAPIDRLVDYWSRFPSLGSPSAFAKERLLRACEKDPDLIPRLLNLFPTDPDGLKRIKALWDAMPVDADGPSWQQLQMHDWLMYNSDCFRKELIQQAETTGYCEDGSVDLAGLESLKSLARLDWAAAQPIVFRLEQTQGLVARTMGLSVHYLHEMETGSALAERIRPGLCRITEDASAHAWARMQAFNAVLKTPWDGWETWYIERFKDPSLVDLKVDDEYYAILLSPIFEAPEKWIPVLTRMIEDPDPVMRDNAINGLIALPPELIGADLLRPMIPWIMDPRWSKTRLRPWFLQLLSTQVLPEAIPSMVFLLANGEEPSERLFAANFMTRNPDPSAIPFLRLMVEHTAEVPFAEFYQKPIFVEALFLCGGFLKSEAMAHLLGYARWMGQNGEMTMVHVLKGEIPQDIRIGECLAKKMNSQKELASEVLHQARALEEKEPFLAEQLREILWSWPVPEADEEVLRRLDSKQILPSDVRAAVDRKVRLVANCEVHLSRLSKGTDWRAGLASVLREDPERSRELLSKGNATTRLAILSAARILHVSLPLGQVALLSKEGRELARAADLYLKAFDFR